MTLKEYRQKRNFDKTPEPAAKAAPNSARKTSPKAQTSGQYVIAEACGYATALRLSNRTCGCIEELGCTARAKSRSGREGLGCASRRSSGRLRQL